MSDFTASNPYAAPLDPLAVSSGLGMKNILRDGKFLIIRNGAILPDLCPVTGEPVPPAPEGYRRPRQLTWIPPWAFLGVFAMGLPLILFIALAQQRGQISYGLSDKAKARAKRLRIICGVLVLVIAGVGVPAAFYPDLMAIAVIVILICVIALLVLSNMIEPIKVAGYRKESWFKLRGCSPAFLNTLPEVPFQSLR